MDQFVVSHKELASIMRRFDFRSLAGRSILVTGGTGMVGYYLSEVILRACEFSGFPSPSMTFLLRPQSGKKLEVLRNHYNSLLVTSDLAQWHSQAKYDYIIHAASPASPTKYGDAESVWAANVGFIQSASQGQLPGVFLFISSGEVYGPDSPNYVQEDFVGAPAPESSRSVYPAAKLEAERRLLDLGDSDKTKSIVVRLFHSYGPGVRFDDGRSFADILWSGAQGKEIELRSIGSDVRTLMYLEDAAVGILTCLTKGSAQQVYNVGSDRPLSIKEFANEVGRLSNVSVRTKSLADVPLEQIGYVHSPNKSLVPSNNKLRNLGWSEEVTWEDGITRSLDWIRREIEKPRKVSLD